MYHFNPVNSNLKHSCTGRICWYPAADPACAPQLVADPHHHACQFGWHTVGHGLPAFGHTHQGNAE
jgi:hypothetical protein